MKKDYVKISKLIKKIIIAIIVLLLIATIAFVCFFNYAFSNGFSKEKMKKYDSQESRINFFNENKENFAFFIHLFETYPDLQSIDYKQDKFSYVCMYEENIINDDIFVCGYKKISFSSEEVKEIESNFNKISDIVRIDRRREEDDTAGYMYFFLMQAVGGSIGYRYCNSFLHCSSADYYRKNDKGKIEENRIDDKWCSFYDSTPSI